MKSICRGFSPFSLRVEDYQRSGLNEDSGVSRVVYADVYPAKSSSTHGTQRSSVFHRQARPQQHAKGTSLFSPPMKSMPLEIMPVTLLPVQLGVVTETLSLRGKNYDFRANKPRP